MVVMLQAIKAIQEAIRLKGRNCVLEMGFLLGTIFLPVSRGSAGRHPAFGITCRRPRRLRAIFLDYDTTKIIDRMAAILLQQGQIGSMGTPC
jgi:hypothetical protein